jgi:phospholipase C
MLPPLPDTSDAARIVAVQRRLPPPTPPATPERSVQEAGVRRSRALPYALHVTASIAARDRISLVFANTGQAGAVFQVYDRRNLESVPRSYTVEPGKTLTDDWRFAGDGYDLFVIAPNGFLRHFTGQSGVAAALAVRYDAAAGAIVLAVTNHTNNPVALSVRANAYRDDGPWRLAVAPGAEAEQRWPLEGSVMWYDFTASAETDLLRFAGRMETGAHGISDPAMAG